MGIGFTRRRFLKAMGACAAYLALVNAGGCGPLGRTAKIGPLRVPMRGPFGTPKVWTLPTVRPGPQKHLWTFRSRPDLRPVAAELSKQVPDTALGHVFLALKEGVGEHGPMILDDQGRPLWFGKHPRARDFKAQRYRGRPVLTWWEGAVVQGHGEGEYVIFDGSYREVRRIEAGHGLHGDLHEFLITSRDTALLTAYAAATADLSAVGGPSEGPVWGGIIQELDLETGKILFEWRSLEHVGIEESYARFPPDNPDFRYHYFHINSIDVDHDGNLIVSARNTWTVYKIDRKMGDILWRLGGKRSDFEMGEGTRTAFQHDARRHPDGTISIFDNGAHPQVHEQSRGIVLKLDEEGMSATLLREYVSPEKLVATSQGDLQLLPNGDAFVGWGSAPFISEFSRDGELLFSARFPPDCESYRAFRFPWTGRPTDGPAVAVETKPEGRVAVYVSWNGATEVATWEVLSGPGLGLMAPLGSVARDGFETACWSRPRDRTSP